MPKIPYKANKGRDEDEEYEIVSFEDFCDKSSNSKTDLLTLNDNINYCLCYESDKVGTNIKIKDESSNGNSGQNIETSLDDFKHSSSKRKGSCSFAPFGRHDTKSARSTKGSVFGIIPRTKSPEESTSKEHRYERFSEDRRLPQRFWDNMPKLGSGVLLIAAVCALCIAAWWAVCGAVGGAWGEEHYRRLWERAHPDNNMNRPSAPIAYEKILPEYRYHDHNNLSTKNKNNSSEIKKKPDLNKKSYTERPPEVMKDLCAQATDDARFDCYPQLGANEQDCVKRGCCWRPATTQGVPYCFYPPQYDTFRFVNMTENKHGITVFYERMRPSGYPDDFDIARIDFKYLSDDVLQIKIYDADNKRFEAPYPEIPLVPGPISNLKYRVVLESSTVGFKIVRNIDNVTILNTQDIGGLILSDKMLQMSAILSADHIYGLGEKQASFLMDINWQTYTLFNFDTPPRENMNLYGTHPFYLALERTGGSHGMLLLNSNAMDVVLQPTPAITYRTIGGILNFFLFLGPSPKEVVAQYTAMVGRPFMPPYWALGFHLCKFDYGSLNVTQQVWQANRDAGIPFDVQWNDLDYMNNSNDFTYDKVKYAGLPEFVKKVHGEGMHYIVLIDPGVSAGETPSEYAPYDRGLELDIFIKNSSNLPFIGKTWNKISTAYPDFTHPKSTTYWVEMFRNFHENIAFDGAWIDMNEPSNLISGSLYGKCATEDLPYKPYRISDEGLHAKTLCMDARHYAGPHYDWHNMYSLFEAMATHFALTEVRGKRPFIISRSTFVGSGHYAGHWSGDINSDWHDMRMTIPDLLSFSLFGIPMMGADICGFNGNASVQLCKRWMQLGAFYPFSRNHNSDSSIPQDPVSLGAEVVAASRAALRQRYRLLPYYYTLFWRAHVYGDTVVRPLFFEYPSDVKSHAIDTQFLIGPYVLVSPLLSEESTTRAYLPPPEPWHSLVDGRYLDVDRHSEAQLGEMDYVAVRGGCIIPVQEPPTYGPVTTTNSRSGPLQLLIVPDKNHSATGELYWDDGDSLNSYEERKYSHIEFKLKNMEISSKISWWGYGVPSVNKLNIFAQAFPVKSVTINEVICQKPNCQFAYNTNTQVLTVFDINLRLDKPFNVKWTYKIASKAAARKWLDLSKFNNTL